MKETYRYVVRVTIGNQSWFAHDDGSRIDNPETATRFHIADAERFVEYMKSWRATCKIIRIIE